MTVLVRIKVTTYIFAYPNMLLATGIGILCKCCMIEVCLRIVINLLCNNILLFSHHFHLLW